MDAFSIAQNRAQSTTFRSQKRDNLRQEKPDCLRSYRRAAVDLQPFLFTWSRGRRNVYETLQTLADRWNARVTARMVADKICDQTGKHPGLSRVRVEMRWLETNNFVRRVGPYNRRLHGGTPWEFAFVNYERTVAIVTAAVVEPIRKAARSLGAAQLKALDAWQWTKEEQKARQNVSGTQLEEGIGRVAAFVSETFRHAFTTGNVLSYLSYAGHSGEFVGASYPWDLATNGPRSGDRGTERIRLWFGRYFKNQKMIGGPSSSPSTEARRAPSIGEIASAINAQPPAPKREPDPVNPIDPDSIPF